MPNIRDRLAAYRPTLLEILAILTIANGIATQASQLCRTLATMLP